MAALMLVAPLSAQAAQGCGLNGLLDTLDPVTRGLVSGLVQLHCSASAQPVVFGNVNPVLGPTDYSGSVQITCTFSLLNLSVPLPPLLVCYDISLSAGHGTQTARIMRDTSDRPLNYNLYKEGTFTAPWGSGPTNKLSDSYFLPLGTASRTYTIHGRIPGGQTAAAGSYLDTIVVTIDY